MAKTKPVRPATDLDLLRKIVREGNSVVQLFSWQDEGFASVPIGAGRECFPVLSRGFRTWLRGQFIEEHEDKRTPSPYALRVVISEIDDRSAHAPEQRIRRRIAADGDYWYIDLGNESREVLKIVPASGVWERENRPPVRFLRSRAMRAYPPIRQIGNVDGDTGELEIGSQKGV